MVIRVGDMVIRVGDVELERGQIWRHKPSGQLSTVLRMDKWFGIVDQVVHKRKHRNMWTDPDKVRRNYVFTGDIDTTFGTGPMHAD